MRRLKIEREFVGDAGREEGMGEMMRGGWRLIINIGQATNMYVYMLQFGKRDGYRPLQFGKREFRPLQFGKRSMSYGNYEE